MKLSDILDPKLRQRVKDALDAASGLKKDVAKECPKPNIRIRQNHKPLMNKLEQEYYDRFCFDEGGLWTVQAVRFKLGNGIWYKPDFFCFSASQKAVEVKGPHAFRGGFENLKMAAHQYPFIKWLLVWKQDSQWSAQEIIA